MSSTSQFRTRATIEKGRKGCKLLAFFEKNPKGWIVGSTKNITTIDVSLSAAAVAAVAKSGEAKKISNRRSNHRQRSSAQTIAILKKIPP